MGKKIIKLTESDLNKIVKRVLEEQQETIELPKEMEKCFKEQFQITDVLEYPKCVELALKAKSPIPMPDNQVDLKLVGACAKQLMKDPQEVTKRFFGFSQCMLTNFGTDNPLVSQMKSIFNLKEDKKKDEEVSWLWKVKKKLKGVSDEQLDYNMRNNLPWDWKGTKEGYYEKMEPRKKNSGSN